MLTSLSALTVYEAADLRITRKKGRRRKNQQMTQVNMFIHS